MYKVEDMEEEESMRLLLPSFPSASSCDSWVAVVIFNEFSKDMCWAECLAECFCYMLSVSPVEKYEVRIYKGEPGFGNGKI